MLCLLVEQQHFMNSSLPFYSEIIRVPLISRAPKTIFIECVLHYDLRREYLAWMCAGVINYHALHFSMKISVLASFEFVGIHHNT